MSHGPKSGPRAIGRPQTKTEMVLATAWKWGPLVSSLLTLCGALIYIHDLREHVAYLRGAVDRGERMEMALRMEVATWQAHVTSLRDRMIAVGIDNLPPSPPMTEMESTKSPTPDEKE